MHMIAKPSSPRLRFRSGSRLILAVAALPALGVPVFEPLVAQQREVRQTQEGVTLNFQDVDLAYVLAALAQAARLSVMYSNLPKVPVTVRTVTPLPAEGLMRVLLDLAKS